MDQSQAAKTAYSKLVDEVSPDSKLLSNCAKAFVVGGLICAGGQFITNALTKSGLDAEKAGGLTSVILVFLGVFLTGLGIYPKLGRFAGAGSIVPITGFANSVASPAIEFKKEGHIMGVGAKMFIVAGPVIVYGLVASMIVGIIHYLTGGGLSV